MTTLALKFILKKEISNLNKEIDKKIARGERYTTEARLHKALTTRLRKLKEGKLGFMSLLV